MYFSRGYSIFYCVSFDFHRFKTFSLYFPMNYTYVDEERVHNVTFLRLNQQLIVKRDTICKEMYSS